MSGLVLSLFPGIGLFDRAFEQEGFCVVRGPDLIWGGDIKTFHPPAGRFDGIIGGPPCQRFSALNQAGRMGLQPLAEDLIPEFERVVREAAPRWFVMESVRQAPTPTIEGYAQVSRVINNRWYGAEQNRVRRFTFGGGELQAIEWSRMIDAQQSALELTDRHPCFTANGTQWDRFKNTKSLRTRAELARGLRLQGLPENYLDHSPFTVEGAIHAVGNGVPLTMGRAVARAVGSAQGLAICRAHARVARQRFFQVTRIRDR